MIDHFGINCADYARPQEFYDRVLGVLGYPRQLDFGDAVDHDAVQAFHDAAVESGAESLHARGCGRSTARATSPPSSGTRTATMSKPSAMRRVGEYV